MNTKVYELASAILKAHTSTLMTMAEAVKLAKREIAKEAKFQGKTWAD